MINGWLLLITGILSFIFLGYLAIMSEKEMEAKLMKLKTCRKGIWMNRRTEEMIVVTSFKGNLALCEKKGKPTVLKLEKLHKFYEFIEGVK